MPSLLFDPRLVPPAVAIRAMLPAPNEARTSMWWRSLFCSVASAISVFLLTNTLIGGSMPTRAKLDDPGPVSECFL